MVVKYQSDLSHQFVVNDHLHVAHSTYITRDNNHTNTSWYAKQILYGRYHNSILNIQFPMKKQGNRFNGRNYKTRLATPKATNTKTKATKIYTHHEQRFQEMNLQT